MVSEGRTHGGEEESYRVIVGSQRSGRIKLKWISEKQAGVVWTGFTGSG
jgi:hypothetical protein